MSNKNARTTKLREFILGTILLIIIFSLGYWVGNYDGTYNVINNNGTYVYPTAIKQYNTCLSTCNELSNEMIYVRHENLSSDIWNRCSDICDRKYTYDVIWRNE